jgi:hypothetical protein
MIFDHKSITNITDDEIDVLVKENYSERQHLEFKVTINYKEDNERLEVLWDIVSFANAGGGYIIVGIRDDGKGCAQKYEPDLVGDTESIKKSIMSLCHDHIVERIEGLEVVSRKVKGNPIVILRVPSSSRIPHMVKYQNRTDFYTRYHDGKREITSSGFIFTKIDNLWDKEISGLKVLIIGKDAVKPQFRKEGSILNEFVKKGGRVILMEQGLIETLDWLPFKIDIDKSSAQSAGTTIRTDLPILEDITERGLSSTMAFRMIPDHPILENIEENDLKYWRGTHQVSNNNFYRPKFWNFTTVAYVGGGNGIEHTPLITLPYGSGLFIFSQFVISDEMSKEPAAYILFNNILKYSLNYTASFYRAGIWASKGSFLYKTLTNFGADIEYIDDFPPSDLSVYKILFIDSDINLEKYKVTLERFLVGGGKIVLRELTPEKFENVKYICRWIYL